MPNHLRRQIDLDPETLAACDAIAFILRREPDADARTGVASVVLRAARAVTRSRKMILEVFPELKDKSFPPELERMFSNKK